MMDRRTKICVVVIFVGLMNFLAYTIGYWILGGEAVHGYVSIVEGQAVYYLVGRAQPVSQLVYICSGIHSISIWVTFGAVMLAMLTLAKDRIMLSMRSAIIRGRAIITAVAVLVAIIAIILTYRFTDHFVRSFDPQIVNVEKVESSK